MPLLPTQVISGTRRKVWWRCPKGHSWRAAVYSRTTLGTGCPVCTGRQVLAGENDLATLYPDIAAQWDEEKNGALHPSNVTAGSNRRVWWRCEKGHSYRAVIAQRVQRGDGCPYCANRKVLPGFNDLATAAPLVAKQWHETLNGALTPEMVTAGSHKKSVVAVLLRPCLENHHLLARGRAAKRLPRLRRKDQTQNQVNPAREGGQKIENLRR